MTLYSITKRIYKAILPNALRRALYINMPKPLKVARAYLIRELGKFAKHDELYDENYYQGYLSPDIEKSYEVIAESIVNRFSPKTVVDVGCGRGQLLLELKKRGIICRGLECSSAALNICRQNGLDVIKFNLECDTLSNDVKADIVVSTEVAEHLPRSCADRFVNILCSIADNVVMTAAEPARTWEEIKWGHDHVNERPKEYWIAKFADNGFQYKKDISTQIRREWEELEVSPWFLPGLMVFKK